jgi:hypothetical protein
MLQSKSPKFMVAIFAFFVLAVATQTTSAQKIDQARLDNAIRRSRDAAKVLQAVTGASENECAALRPLRPAINPDAIALPFLSGTLVRTEAR